MTDTTETTTPADATPTEGEQQTPDPTPAEETPEEPQHKRPEHEAAKYRRQLRETEAERDALAARLETWERQYVELIATPCLEHPKTLWALGYTLDDMRNSDGKLDPAVIRKVCTAAQRDHGLQGALKAHPIYEAVEIEGFPDSFEGIGKALSRMLKQGPIGYELRETDLINPYRDIPTPGGGSSRTPAKPAWARIIDPNDRLRD